MLNATYHPSTYEKEWARLVAQPGGVMGLPVCLLLAEPQHKGRVERILRVLDAQHEEEAGRLPAGATDAALDELEKEVDEGQLLSRMEYTLSDGTAVSVRMEPLVGLLRDPRQFCPEGSRSPWMPQVPDMMHGDMREWLLLDGRRAQLHQGQRAVLMDMGASTWGHTGARWLNHRLQQHGMAYEHIWSFEAKSKPVMEFLNGAAPVDMARIHFYNVPVGGAVDPWAMLKSTAKPEDFVAVKLDIDTMAVEIPLAYQLLEDPELLALVDEVSEGWAPTVHPRRSGDSLTPTFNLFALFSAVLFRVPLSPLRAYVALWGALNDRDARPRNAVFRCPAQQGGSGVQLVLECGEGIIFFNPFYDDCSHAVMYTQVAGEITPRGVHL